MDFADLFSKVLATAYQQNSEVFIVISWLLWQRRNKKRLGQDVLDIDQVGNKARAYLNAFVSSFDTPPPTELTPAVNIKWQPSRDFVFKVNYDGAVFQETNEAGIGVIIRNQAGKVMATLVQKVRYPQSVECIEAWAAKRAVQFIS